MKVPHAEREGQFSSPKLDDGRSSLPIARHFAIIYPGAVWRQDSNFAGKALGVARSSSFRELQAGGRCVVRVEQRTASPLILAVLIAAAVPVALAVDLRVVEWTRTYSIPGGLWKIIKLAEVFGHVFAVVVAAVLIGRLDPAWRRKVPSLVISVAAAGLAANLIKLIVVRSRPDSFDSLDFIDSVLETFGGVLPFISAGSSGQSFPSGHSALAAGLATSLALFYPRAGLLFAVLASLVMLQRVVTDSHFLSDVLAGAALGIVVAHLAAMRFERYVSARTG